MKIWFEQGNGIVTNVARTQRGLCYEKNTKQIKKIRRRNIYTPSSKTAKPL